MGWILRYLRELNGHDTSSIWKHLHFRNYLANRDIQASDFRNVQYLATGCDGLVTKCSLLCILNDKETEVEVALKMIINMGEGETKSHAQKCAIEFGILSDIIQLHPNIVRYLGKFIGTPTEQMIKHVHSSLRDLCYRGNNIPKKAQFFILQWYPKTLQEVVESEHLSKQRVIKYSVHLARALLHLYESKIVHLDLKLNNIMLSSLDEIIVVDFGCAGKVISNSDYLIDVQLTNGGNPFSLAPEVIYNARTKVQNFSCKAQYSWELGMNIYRILSKNISPFDVYSPPYENIEVDWAPIPEEWLDLLKKLICNQDKRMHIIDAWKYLEDMAFAPQ